MSLKFAHIRLPSLIKIVWAFALLTSSPSIADGGGHDVNQSSEYNYYTLECHNAANYFLSHRPKGNHIRGIVSCCGDLAIKTQEGHTYNWEIIPGADKSRADHICLYNWASKVCWDAPKPLQNPPVIPKGEPAKFFKSSCDEQCPGKAVLLPANRKVAFAGGGACIREVRKLPLNSLNIGSLTRSPSDPPHAQEDCKRCCAKKVTTWRDSIAGEKDAALRKRSNSARKRYFNSCLVTCDNTFGNADGTDGDAVEAHATPQDLQTHVPRFEAGPSSEEP